MLKVLLMVDHAVGISGPHRNVVGSLNALTARHDVAVRLLTGRIDPSEPYARSGRLDIRLGFDPHNPRAVFPNIRLVMAAAKGVDSIYVPSGLKAFLYAQLVRRGRRLVAGPNVTHLPIRKADSPGWLELACMCDLWLEASEARARHVIRHTGMADKVRVVHHAIDTEKFSPVRRAPEVWRRYGVPGDSVKVLLVCADDEPGKGIGQFLEAVAIYGKSREAVPAAFVLVGRTSSATRQRAANLRNIHLLGFLRGCELAQVYASADIAVVPSVWEGFGFTVLEAMASGLAVIASRAGGIPEQIEDGVSGVLVDLVDENGGFKPEAGQILAAALAELAADPERRKRLGAAARQRVLNCFNERLLGERLVEVLRPSSCPGCLGGK